jgi:hypothetical protein
MNKKYKQKGGWVSPIRQGILLFRKAPFLAAYISFGERLISKHGLWSG